MVTLRCTHKLLRRLHLSPQAGSTPPTTVLGDWYANLFYSRPRQLVLCMNERTLLLVLVPARDAKSLGPRFCEAAAAHLKRIGVPDAAVEAEACALNNYWKSVRDEGEEGGGRSKF